MADYEIIQFIPDTTARHQHTFAEIWADMIAGAISPALAEIRLARLTNWLGYVRTSVCSTGAWVVGRRG